MKNRQLLALIAAVAVLLVGARAWACGGMDHGSHGDTGSNKQADEKSKEAKVPIDQFLTPYLSIRAALAADSLDSVATDTDVFVQAVKFELAKYPEEKKGTMEKMMGKAKPYAKKALKIAKKIPCAGHVAGMVDEEMFDEKVTRRGQLEKLLKAAQPLANKKIKLADARDSFGALSDEFVTYLKANASPEEAKNFQLFHCGMAKHHWVQKADEDIGNPYFGAKMPDCGEKLAFHNHDATNSGPDAGTKPEEHKHNHGM